MISKKKKNKKPRFELEMFLTDGEGGGTETVPRQNTARQRARHVEATALLSIR